MNLTLSRLSTETLHEFLDYFDHRAFLNDEDWAGCYCQAYLHPPETPMEEIFGPGKAREMVCDLVPEGKMDGYLARIEDRVVGWCAAGSSKLFRALPEAEDLLARIICFNIDPDFRNQGIAGEILDQVITDLQERGFSAVEAAPTTDAASEKSFQGTEAMFEARGFEKIAELPTGQVLMRRFFD